MKLGAAVFGLCHDKSSHSFSMMKHYDKYASLESCLSVPGSRVPKHMANASNVELSSTRAIQSFSNKSYNRHNWKHWNEGQNPNDCINTRHETLVRQAVPRTVTMSRDGCFVSTGKWLDDYSGDLYVNPRDLDIDHIVPLNYAYKHGGANWSKSKKELFANDPINLIAVSASLNREKSAKGPANWLPPNHSYRCQYLARWQQVLIKYPSIVMNSAEQRTVRKMAQACISK
ncbi:HNH endonuclease family protein [Colwellia sp. MSW7]|uniref:HNH endonuclease family protein n=1 Tax=Colwellia maritima TaxID=2912588 RepID=A0ABS9X6N3_9GAMM|nr:HNH endonuclease family protein [Colwellia maritima]MCI2285898.1 HNH endonuclease family protein [Colwellia maritima]